MIFEIDNKWIFVFIACLLYIAAMMYNKQWGEERVSLSNPRTSEREIPELLGKVRKNPLKGQSPFEPKKGQSPFEPLSDSHQITPSNPRSLKKSSQNNEDALKFL